LSIAVVRIDEKITSDSMVCFGRGWETIKILFLVKFHVKLYCTWELNTNLIRSM
jgi:hypothetical protein